MQRTSIELRVQSSPPKSKNEEWDVKKLNDVDSEGINEIYENAPVNVCDKNFTDKKRRDAVMSL